MIPRYITLQDIYIPSGLLGIKSVWLHLLYFWEEIHPSIHSFIVAWVLVSSNIQSFFFSYIDTYIVIPIDYSACSCVSPRTQISKLDFILLIILDWIKCILFIYFNRKRDRTSGQWDDERERRKCGQICTYP